MGLPIPTILENAGAVLEAAANLINSKDSWRIRDSTDLAEAVKKVNKNDLLAVLNEVGGVYMGLHNIQVKQIGTKPSDDKKSLEIAIQVDFGLGPKVLVTLLPVALAEQFYNAMGEDIAKMKPKGLITNLSA